MDKTLNSILVEKVVIIKPIFRKSSVLPKGHDGEFLFDGAKKSFSVPKTMNNVYADPLSHLTTEQKESLAEALSITAKDLNINNPKCYWYMKFVSLERDERRLYLSNLNDYIAYCILKSNINLIAPSWSERFNSAEYLYAIVEQDEEIKEKIGKTNDIKRAYMLFGKMEDSDKKLSDFLFAYNLEQKNPVKIDGEVTLEKLYVAVSTILDEQTKSFLEILEDENYATKVLIMRGISVGAIVKDEHTYKIPGGETMSNLPEMVGYLDNKLNSAERLRINLLVDEEGKKKSIKKPIIKVEA